MDWRQFIASIIGSLAWPSVVVALLFMLRRQLAGLAERIEELAFGSAKATFARALVKGEANTDQIVATFAEGGKPAIAQSKETFTYMMAENFPEAAIMESFREVQETLGEILHYFTGVLPTKGRSPRDIVGRLLQDGYIDTNAAELFQSLQEARNAVTHGGWGRRITPGEALEYRRQAQTLNAFLRGVLAGLKDRHGFAEHH